MATITYKGLSGIRGTLTVNSTDTLADIAAAIIAIEELNGDYYADFILDRNNTISFTNNSTDTYAELGLVSTDTLVAILENDPSVYNKEQRQLQKLEIAQVKRAGDGNPRATYDITQLPNLYNGNAVDPDENPNTGGLVEGRPWIEQAWTLPPGMDRNEPYNGSGGSNPTVPGAQYKTAAARGVPVYSGSGITFNDLSASALDSISNEASGLYRRKYVGKLLSTYGAWTEYLSSWFSDPTRGPISEATFEVDEYVSFGYRSDLGAENGYSLEWKGYLKAPVTGNMRFFVDVDDDIMIWIGASALAPTKDNYLLAQSGGTRSGTNGITVVAGKYYPVRMAFIEYGGAEQFQIFANSSAGATVYNGQDLDWAHNTATKGY
jgi:hypothetical protein